MKFKNSGSGDIILNLIDVIHENRDFLSKIDGEIGDGDHGINMDKGFTLCGKKLKDMKYSMSEGFNILGKTLLEDIGGSMGPLYGMFFNELSAASEDLEDIDASDLECMFKLAIAGIEEIGGAKEGDKTLLDTLIPAVKAYSFAIDEDNSFDECLEVLKLVAREGWQSTRDMVAKIGRASRLGERSRGVLDPGATSCYLIINSIVTSIQDLLK